MEQNIDQLFQKFVDNTLTKKEYKKLMDFIKDPKSQNVVEKMMDEYWDQLANVEKGPKWKNVEADMLYHKIQHKVDNADKRQKGHSLVKKLNRSSLYKIAAVFLLAAGLFYGDQKGILNGSNSLEPNSEKAPTENITLTLDDGIIEVISENGQGKIMDAKGKFVGAQNGSQLSYQNTVVTEEVGYNTLSVPYGKRFDLLLSDGSQVKLNAGSSIRYPVRFIKGEDRKVFLNGEAYFDVAEDKDHPFVVNAKDINVQVLGTQFNMSYYPEDDDISTVLVEGSVKLYNGDSGGTNESSTLLTPGHLAAWNKTTGEMSVEKVDPQIYTAWKEGTLLFKNESFKNIRMKLERHFNIAIENRYPFLENQIYTASFSGETLEEIMEAFNEDTSFEFEYKLVNNKIIITDQTINTLNQPSQ